MDGFRSSTNVPAAESTSGPVLVGTSSSQSSDAGNTTEPPSDYKKMDKQEPAEKQETVDSSLEKDANRAPVAEFLYQLIKMLEDGNDEIIEWSEGRIKVHHPERLEAEVLSRYFRHSKFASFQRQLNYFGFRKIAGKGKMSPCSYVNDAATKDLRSLLLIKRKTNGSAARKAAMKQAMAANAAAAANMGHLAAFNMGALNGYSQQSMHGMQPNGMMLQDGMLALRLQQQLQQQQQQKALGEGFFFPSDNALSALIAAGQKNQSMEGLARLSATASAAGLGNGMGNLWAGATPGAFQAHMNGGAPGMNPVTAAMSASTMPATAAAAALGKESNTIGESNPTLDSFVNDQSNPGKKPPTPRGIPPHMTSQTLLNRLPSSSAIFPDNLSTVSLTNLLSGMGSANRLSSMLSLNGGAGGGYMSREQSLADMFGGAAAASQLPNNVNPPLMPQSLAAFAPAPPNLSSPDGKNGSPGTKP